MAVFYKTIPLKFFSFSSRIDGEKRSWRALFFHVQVDLVDNFNIEGTFGTVERIYGCFGGILGPFDGRQNWCALSWHVQVDSLDYQLIVLTIKLYFCFAKESYQRDIICLFCKRVLSKRPISELREKTAIEGED